MSSKSHTWATTFLLIILAGCGVRISPIVGSNTIAELTAIVIGGLEQWVMIRGVDRFNRIFLWKHGGFGAAQMPVHRALNKELKEKFEVIHWAQRGAGRCGRSCGIMTCSETFPPSGFRYGLSWSKTTTTLPQF
jgi:hypothetical protein